MGPYIIAKSKLPMEVQHGWLYKALFSFWRYTVYYRTRRRAIKETATTILVIGPPK